MVSIAYAVILGEGQTKTILLLQGADKRWGLPCIKLLAGQIVENILRDHVGETTGILVEVREQLEAQQDMATGIVAPYICVYENVPKSQWDCCKWVNAQDIADYGLSSQELRMALDGLSLFEKPVMELECEQEASNAIFLSEDGRFLEDYTGAELRIWKRLGIN